MNRFLTGLCLGKNSLRRVLRALAPIKRAVSRKASAMKASTSTVKRRFTMEGKSGASTFRRPPRTMQMTEAQTVKG